LEFGNWKLEIGNWKLEIGNWKLEFEISHLGWRDRWDTAEHRATNT
jgi:hypothetical protein